MTVKTNRPQRNVLKMEVVDRLAYPDRVSTLSLLNTKFGQDRAAFLVVTRSLLVIAAPLSKHSQQLQTVRNTALISDLAKINQALVT